MKHCEEGEPKMLISVKQFEDMTATISSLAETLAALIKLQAVPKWIIPKGSGIEIKDFE